MKRKDESPEEQMMKLLEIPDTAFTEGRLQYVEPESWKNVGASIVHAVRQLKDHQVEMGNHLVPIKQFLD